MKQASGKRKCSSAPICRQVSYSDYLNIFSRDLEVLVSVVSDVKSFYLMPECERSQQGSIICHALP